MAAHAQRAGPAWDDVEQDDDDIYEDSDDGADSPDEGDGAVDEFDVSAVPIFTSGGVRRLFVVEKTLRCVSSYRPSFEYLGRVVELGAAASPDSGRVLEAGLTLSLRYEPPSPKFTAKCPGSASYRLKVSRGEEFLYSTRGLNKRVVVSGVAKAVVWGNLELGF
eukprot:CAMPEP_0183798300 /NCGR_PEP_ID=MMETSP0803_2-20130417/18410_1 /TAXON_ID=195967 /ORGANISM="Crustomastix stigmata, Strain CCMP3273" /LENGTH=163 /DNA_ID=CAMNT_0026042979 /DNA_START=93 /DNA_END=581 /DNA_ORIENTATION=-